MMPFQPDYIYPLREPTRFDDDMGTGYDHALLADYGPIAPECYVHDAWIVTARGEVHPGYARGPVPIRLVDVDETQGRSYLHSPISGRNPARPTRLTMKRLRAIQEALMFRLAGEIEDGDDAIPAEDYDTALDWVSEQIARRG
jgi:hypothetical protein